MKIKVVIAAQKMTLLFLVWLTGLLFAGEVLDMASYIIPFARMFPLPLAGKVIVYPGFVMVVGFLLYGKSGELSKR